MGKAVVQLDHLHITRPDTRLLVDLARGLSRHVQANHLSHVMRLKGGRGIGGHGLGLDAYRLVQTMALREGFAAHNGSCTATGGRASHQAGHHAGPHHRCVQHVFFSEHLSEQCQWIVGRMTAGLGTYAGEGGKPRAVLLHVRQTRATKVAQRKRHALNLQQRIGFGLKAVKRRGAVFINITQGSGLHLLKADGQRALHTARSHRLTCQKKRSGARRAVVVDIENRHARHTNRIRCTLTGAGIAVDIPRINLLYGTVVKMRILQGGAHRLRAHHVVQKACTRHGEGDHAHTRNKNITGHFSSPLS